MRRPIWFLNMCALEAWDKTESHLSALVYWQKFMNEYIDKTLVSGDVEAEAVVRVCLRLFDRFADFTKLSTECHGLRGTHRRLRGLAV